MKMNLMNLIKRGITLKNLISKYGEDLGNKYFNDYVTK